MDHQHDSRKDAKNATKNGRLAPRDIGGRFCSGIAVTLQAASNQGLAMIRIGIVGVGFMGMIHYREECKSKKLPFSRKKFQ